MTTPVIRIAIGRIPPWQIAVAIRRFLLSNSIMPALLGPNPGPSLRPPRLFQNRGGTP
jgi:hypothetical protein